MNRGLLFLVTAIDIIQALTAHAMFTNAHT
jgi:hypothetical protein